MFVRTVMSALFALVIGAPITAFAADDGEEIVYVIPIQGPIEPALLYVIRRGVAEAQDVRAKAIIFSMDTPGGTLDAAREIVNLIENVSVPTYTFVEEEAFSAGAIIAMATDHIYMSPGSVIGDAMPIMMSPFSGPQEMPENLQEKMVSAVAALIRSAAEQGGHNKELAEAMVRRENEFKIGDTVICPVGELLTLTDEEARQAYVEDGLPLLSAGTVEDIPALLAQVGYEGATIRELRVSSAETFARFIQSLSILFLGAGLLGLYIEIKTPGFGLPGILGAISLVIFFYGHHIAGLAGTEEVMLVLLGLILLVIEVFVLPGFGIAGISGLFLIFWGLLLAMVEHYPGGPRVPSWTQFDIPLMNLSLSMVVTVIFAAIIGKYLPQSPIFSRLRLEAATSRELGFTSSRDDFTALIGARGTAVTQLRPAGAALFGDRRLDVVTAGDFIDNGASVRIVETHGSRIVVERDAHASPAGAEARG